MCPFSLVSTVKIFRKVNEELVVTMFVIPGTYDGPDGTITRYTSIVSS